MDQKTAIARKMGFPEVIMPGNDNSGRFMKFCKFATKKSLNFVCLVVLHLSLEDGSVGQIFFSSSFFTTRMVTEATK